MARGTVLLFPFLFLSPSPSLARVFPTIYLSLPLFARRQRQRLELSLLLERIDRERDSRFGKLKVANEAGGCSFLRCPSLATFRYNFD